MNITKTWRHSNVNALPDLTHDQLRQIDELALER